MSTLNYTQLCNLTTGLEQIHCTRPNADLKPGPWVIGMGTSKAFGTTVCYDHLPTITKTHASRREYWVVKHGDFVSEAELLRCQGFELSDVIVPANVSHRKMLEMVGNAYTAPVIHALFADMLKALGRF